MSKMIKIFILIGIVLFLGVSGILLIEKKKKQLSNLPVPEKPLYTVRGSVVKIGSITVKREFLGQIRSENVVSVSSNISGYLKNLYVDVGQKVKKGQLLSVIDDNQIKNRIKNLQIDIKDLELRLSSLKVRETAFKTLLLTKENTYRRDKRLFEKKAISKEKLEKSYSSYLLTKSQLKDVQTEIQSVQNRIKQKKNELDTLRNNLSYLRIKSPVDGIVQSIYLREGNLVMPGKTIMKIEEAGRYEVIVKVPDSYNVKEGDYVEIGFNGKIQRYRVSMINPSSSNYLKVVKIKIGKKPEGTVTDSLVNVAFVKKIKGFVVPNNAVLNLSSGSYLISVNKGRFVTIPVKVKGANKRYAVVSGDIKEDMVVAVGDESKLRMLSTGKEGKIILEKE